MKKPTFEERRQVRLAKRKGRKEKYEKRKNLKLKKAKEILNEKSGKSAPKVVTKSAAPKGFQVHKLNGD